MAKSFSCFSGLVKRLFLILVSFIICCNLYAGNYALLVGIGNYDKIKTGWARIHGNNDVALLDSRLKAKGFKVSRLIDGEATKANIKSALSRLVASAKNGDVIYLHFSGHGQLIADMNNDEQEELDQSFVCYDACFSPNYKISGKDYRGQNHFIDDELFPFLNSLKRKVGKDGHVTVAFDSCYSGGADRGEQTDDPDPENEVEWSETTRGTDDEFPVNQSARTYLRSITKPGNYTGGGGTITIISACGSDKKNYECEDRRSGRKYGSLSFCIGKMIDLNIPMDSWGDYFKNKKYKSLRIFRPSQIPVAETH